MCKACYRLSLVQIGCYRRPVVQTFLRHGGAAGGILSMRHEILRPGQVSKQLPLVHQTHRMFARTIILKSIALIGKKALIN